MVRFNVWRFQIENLNIYFGSTVPTLHTSISNIFLRPTYYMYATALPIIYVFSLVKKHETYRTKRQGYRHSR